MKKLVTLHHKNYQAALVVQENTLAHGDGHDSQSQTGASECEAVTIIQSSIIKMTRLPLLSKLTSHGDGHDCERQTGAS